MNEVNWMRLQDELNEAQKQLAAACEREIRLTEKFAVAEARLALAERARDEAREKETCSACGGLGWLNPCSYDEEGVPCPRCNPKSTQYSAQRELAEAREDTARLEWCAEQLSEILEYKTGGNIKLELIWNDQTGAAQRTVGPECDTPLAAFRAAIDRALTEGA